jgi:tight adherence protein B
VLGTLVAAQAAANYRRRFLAKTEQKVEALYLAISPERLWLYALLGAGGGALLMAFLTGFTPVPVALGAVGGFMIPRAYLRNVEQKRHRTFDTQLLAAVTTVAGAMRAGMSLLQALEQVTREMGPPIRQEFAHILHENRVGKPLNQALQDMKNRINSEDLSITVNAIGIAQETGGVLSEVLMNIVETIRSRNRVRAKIDALTAQGRLQGIVMALMPWGLAAVLFLLDRDMIRPMFTSAKGQIVLAVVCFLEFMGWLVIRRLVTVDV